MRSALAQLSRSTGIGHLTMPTLTSGKPSKKVMPSMRAFVIGNTSSPP